MTLEGDEVELNEKWEAVMKMKKMDLNIATELSDEHSHFKFIEQFSDRNAPSWYESEDEEEEPWGQRNETENEEKERARSLCGVDEELKVMTTLASSWDPENDENSSLNSEESDLGSVANPLDAIKLKEQGEELEQGHWVGEKQETGCCAITRHDKCECHDGMMGA